MFDQNILEFLNFLAYLLMTQNNKIMKSRKEVKPYVGEDGRQKVFLYDKDGNGKEEDLAALVAMTFTDICGKPVEGKLPSFKDGNPSNCAANNLYWE